MHVVLQLNAINFSDLPHGGRNVVPGNYGVQLTPPWAADGFPHQRLRPRDAVNRR
jgi:hypothetical protein